MNKEKSKKMDDELVADVKKAVKTPTNEFEKTAPWDKKK